jgi:hypothetical protein
MKAYERVDAEIHVFSFTPLSLYPRAGLDDMEKSKFLTLPGLERRLLCLPARSQSLYLRGVRQSFYENFG